MVLSVSPTPRFLERTEPGSLVEEDLWIDERRGVILDTQVGRSAWGCKLTL